MRTGDTLRENAYAKINLFLDVTGKRSDGYHDIASIMQTVSLCDSISVTVSDSDGISCSDTSLACDKSNLAWKALDLFRHESGMDFSASIRIEKNIPVAAGMAGGSTDAAAVLRILNRMTGEPFSADALASMSAKIGSDVPFCVSGGTKLARGRGEILSDIPSCPKMFLVVAIRGEHVSTPWAYGLIDTKFGDFSEHKTEKELSLMKNALLCGDALSVINASYNIFEEPVSAHRPQVTALKNELMAYGAVRALMSGSGPSVIGFFDDEKVAQSAEKKLRESGTSAFFCTTT